ncbi:MAG: hypothetical protein KGI00_04685 [Candidatus Micrarchaeota archaeon]|nr:hypothetical protein [Candidatus Micrarchaeota archaeon]MDE1824329.1 hypothetical protein [Candidatus Micrarchaeota archaeon]MDE1849997.1 hypothetical protein [Candidatus Micrarchaeota archaeon]
MNIHRQAQAYLIRQVDSVKSLAREKWEGAVYSGIDKLTTRADNHAEGYAGKANPKKAVRGYKMAIMLATMVRDREEVGRLKAKLDDYSAKP